MNRPNVDSGEKDGSCGPTLVASDPRTYHAYYGATFRLLSETVILSVATIRDVDPTDSCIPLVDVIDPDALDTIFADTYRGTKRTGGYVTFTVDGLTVYAHSNGHVVLLDRRADDTTAN